MTKKRTIFSQNITLLHVSTLPCHSQGACKSIPHEVTQVFQRQLSVRTGSARQQHQHTDCIYNHHTEWLNENCSNKM